MVTTDEIRKRVEDADRDRVKRRADAAEAIATAVEQRTMARAALAELEASIAAQVKQSEAVMSLAELAQFTGIPVTELRSTSRGARSRKATRSPSPRGRSTRTAGRARADSASAPAAGSDVGGGGSAPTD
jgi:endonuclease/exonuclease/phosphatase (EEP) superfamily protein YafD